MNTGRAGLWFLIALISLGNAACQCNHAVCFEEKTIVNRLELRDRSNKVIWRLSGDGRHTITDVDHGRVPPGYSQVFPGKGTPRPLRNGEELLLLWRSGDHFVRHWGTAGERNSVHYGSWEDMPVNGRTDSELFIDSPNTIEERRNGYPQDLPPARASAPH